MAVNNEIGSIQPINQIAEILEAHPRIPLPCGCCSTIAKVDQQQWFATTGELCHIFCPPKFHGPRGVGFIYWKKGRKLAPLMTGGGQEQNQRSGTERYRQLLQWLKRCG